MSAAGNAVPSVWYDESASIGAATRDWSGLAGLLGHVDAVHGLYYAVLHCWFAVVGYTPFLLRLPSALAVGGTVALLALLAERLAGRRAGWTTGAVAALLPALTWAGGEGRSYALTAFAATASTTALVHALSARRSRRASWAAYGAVTALGGVLFVHVLLLLPAHLLTVLVLRRRRPVPLRTFLAAGAGAVVLASPLLVLAASQRSQIAWIAPLSPQTLIGVLVNQWFTAAPPYAAVAWIVLGATAVRAVRRPVLVRAPLTAASIAVPWAVVPTAVLLAASLVQPAYLPRYLTFAAPAVALLLGTILARHGRRGVAVVALLGVLAVPPLVGSRMPEAKFHSVWARTAAFLEEQRGAEPGGAVVYGLMHHRLTATTGAVAVSYPDAFRGLDDVTARGPRATSTALWQPRRPLIEALPALQQERTVWLLTDVRVGDRDEDASSLVLAGLRPAASWRFDELRLERFERTTPSAAGAVSG